MGALLPETIKYPEAIKRYQCSRRTLEYAVAAGDIEAFKPGAAVLLVVDSADKWFFSKRLKPNARKGRPRGTRKR